MLKAGSTAAPWRLLRLVGGVSLGALVLAACTTPNRAPVVDLSGSQASGTGTQVGPSTTYVVRPGDTLYSIARQHGVTWQEVASWNGIADPSQLRVGRTLTIGGGGSAAPATGGGTGMAQVQPIPTPTVEVRPLDGSSASTPSTPRPVQANDSGIDWLWPAQGRVIAEYNQALNKGIDIEGNVGDPVVAAADGTVVYAGSGLRGYGNLLIIRHNATFLSAYAHNSRLLVSEGQEVKRGQRVAELGQTDAPSPRLHFEVRRGGTPEDPMRFLPPR